MMRIVREVRDHLELVSAHTHYTHNTQQQQQHHHHHHELTIRVMQNTTSINHARCAILAHQNFVTSQITIRATSL